MSTFARRGKWAEDQVKDLFSKLNTEPTFYGTRLPDAKAGSKQPALADFQIIRNGHYALIEVKEIEGGTSTRLPYKSFATDKVSRMVRATKAGAGAWVLVCFKPKGIVRVKNIWRAVPLYVFQERNEATPSGSWDLKDWPLETLEAIFGRLYTEAGA